MRDFDVDDLDDEDDAIVGHAPICPSCGVTALPDERARDGARFVCENPDCEAFGGPV